ncbi:MULTISPECIES: hypothetical protein [unclassified Streptomyces]|uniref:hypothetical protein n=1 Tax=unclassified Streptomyces TaxID=2593676 RepID=UPI003409A5BF
MFPHYENQTGSTRLEVLCIKGGGLDLPDEPALHLAAPDDAPQWWRNPRRCGPRSLPLFLR